MSDTTQTEETRLDVLSNEKNELEENINNVTSDIELIQNQLSEELFKLEELNKNILENRQQIELMKAEQESLQDFIKTAEVELE